MKHLAPAGDCCWEAPYVKARSISASPLLQPVSLSMVVEEVCHRMANLRSSTFAYVSAKLALVVCCLLIPALMGAVNLWAGLEWVSLPSMSWPMTVGHLLGADVATTLLCSCVLAVTPLNPQALRNRHTHQG